MIERERLERALTVAREHLLAARRPEGYWEGWLSSSALSTATAVSALALAGLAEDEALVAGGVQWLAQTQNGGGGWGDTTDSPSNVATSLLALSALRLAASRPAGVSAGDQNAPILSQEAVGPELFESLLLS